MSSGPAGQHSEFWDSVGYKLRFLSKKKKMMMKKMRRRRKRGRMEGRKTSKMIL